MESKSRRDISHFEGTWQIARQIEDRMGGQEAHFSGRAKLRPLGEHWLWQESGEIRYGAGPALKAERSYLWRPMGRRIAVHFEDGAFFHDFDPEAPAPEAEHFCTPDLYHAAYDFTRWPRWQVTWEVAGPRKDYRMTSECRRPETG
ncbi:hypothetical protein SAMN06297129_3234 [Pseudooceanicola antarcticus]|uniref:Trigger factor n=1 Tax=Pseudooceanicola antarcticus TaxID=1247613 RepID=A0A285JA24_9RHOB|nr:DUF6314 family protein [Pseudooceanicola antarcticus]PJE27040.1 trigger factor [Pseudooceanicola antarcticus]SNY56246.1 hypothetical protein SAMN06297129_3234 [Pseudooceanicola antarcticus]